MTTIGWIVSIAAFVVAAVIFFLLGIRYRKNVAEREISSAGGRSHPHHQRSHQEFRK